MRGITTTKVESMSGKILLMQLIYKIKTNMSLPAAEFSAGFELKNNKKHCSLH